MKYCSLLFLLIHQDQSIHSTLVFIWNLHLVIYLIFHFTIRSPFLFFSLLLLFFPPFSNSAGHNLPLLIPSTFLNFQEIHIESLPFHSQLLPLSSFTFFPSILVSCLPAFFAFSIPFLQFIVP